MHIFTVRGELQYQWGQSSGLKLYLSLTPSQAITTIHIRLNVYFKVCVLCPVLLFIIFLSHPVVSVLLHKTMYNTNWSYL